MHTRTWFLASWFPFASWLSCASSHSLGQAPRPLGVPAATLPTLNTSGVPQPAGAAGNLKVLNWAGRKGAASYTFDDGGASQLDHYAELHRLGVRMTFYLTTNSETMSNPLWRQAALDGHELGNHTQTHPPTADGKDIDAATTFIQAHFGVTPYTMAAPYGNPSFIQPAKSRFLANRGVVNGLVKPLDHSDPFNLPCYGPATGARATDMNPQMDSALASGGWRIVLVHGFTGGSDGAYQPIAIEEFTTAVTYAKNLGLWVDSVVNVAAYWIGQKVVAAATPTTSGADLIYTWHPPRNFPRENSYASPSAVAPRNKTAWPYPGTTKASTKSR